MDFEFKQRRIFDKRRAKILNNGVEFEINTLSASQQFTVPFEKVGFRVSKYSKPNAKWLLGVLLGGGLLLTIPSELMRRPFLQLIPDLLFVSTIFVGCLLGFIVSAKTVFFLSNSKTASGLSFLTNPEKDKELKAFLTELKLKRDNYLYTLYANVDKTVPINTTKMNLLSLKENDVITEAVWQQKMDELEKITTHQKIAGFGNNKN